MACACQGNQAASSFTYTLPDGGTQVFRTEIEAQAAIIRNGGGEYVANT